MQRASTLGRRALARSRNRPDHILFLLTKQTPDLFLRVEFRLKLTILDGLKDVGKRFQVTLYKLNVADRDFQGLCVCQRLINKQLDAKSVRNR